MTTYGDLVAAHLSDPTPESLDALRAAVRAAPGFDPELRVRERAEELLGAGDPVGAVQAVEATMPGSLFSPRAHALLAAGFERSERGADASRHARLARASLDSILSTGDGTRERPWSVLRISDEYDVVASLGTRPSDQSLVRDGQRTIDVLTCADGRQLHFDVSRVPGAAVRA